MGASDAQGSRLAVVGRYAFCAEIAAGGMATVHLGRMHGSVGFNRTVAIKRLHAQFAKDPPFVAMFVDEARIVARIRHPNVVPTLDIVSEDGELFIVMEYVHGASLARLIRQAQAADGQGVPPAIAASIMSGVLHGLHAAHEAKNEQGQPLDTVHRDVSPQNVLVGSDGVARVLDFGVAKAANRLQTTRDGQLKGKLSYMSPEQLSEDDVDRRTDVYAAAVVLWEALTARRLFQADNPGAALTKIFRDRVMPPSEVVTGISSALDAVVLKGLAREPTERYATARAMALALEDAIPLASTAQVGSWVERVGKETLDALAELVSDVENSEVRVSMRALKTVTRAKAADDELTQTVTKNDADAPASVTEIAEMPREKSAPRTTSVEPIDPTLVTAGNARRKSRLPFALVGAVLLLGIGLFIAARSNDVPHEHEKAAPASATLAAQPITVEPVIPSLEEAPAPSASAEPAAAPTARGRPRPKASATSVPIAASVAAPVPPPEDSNAIFKLRK